MNIGNLPGYYWDAEKKKYFRILANHVAPSDAKYSKTRVKNEDRAIKKRKLAELKEHAKLKQTVRRPLHRNPLLNAAGLDRESGCQATQDSLYSSRDAAFAEHLTATTDDWPCTVLHHCPEAQGGGVVALSDMGRSTIFHNKARKKGVSGSSKSIAAFHSTLTSLDVLSNGAIIGIAQERRCGSNVYIGPSWEMEALTGSNGMYMNVGPNGVTDFSIWSTAMNRAEDRIAISSSRDTYCLDLYNDAQAVAYASVPHEGESRDVAWLDHNVIAYGDRELKLWDTRSFGSATRFSRRSSSPITGIFSPNQEGLQLLVSDNRQIELRDTRMTTKGAVLAWPHEHQGPKLQAAVQGELQCIAAVDISDKVQVYSLRSGRSLGALKPVEDIAL
ncbi:hypothetical protein LTR86_000608 [Recurvomyces mirabilis]|nr:hypothetical protein LTR86_000608 [Recurvomyces mirabilis]